MDILYTIVENQKITCSASQSVTVRRKTNVSPSFGRENGFTKDLKIHTKLHIEGGTLALLPCLSCSLSRQSFLRGQPLQLTTCVQRIEEIFYFIFVWHYCSIDHCSIWTGITRMDNSIKTCHFFLKISRNPVFFW